MWVGSSYKPSRKVHTFSICLVLLYSVPGVTLLSTGSLGSYSFPLPLFSPCTVPQPTLVITRSHTGIVYAGTEFTLTTSIIFTNQDMRGVDVDLTLDIIWTSGSDVIISNTRITVSGVSGSDTSYTASLTFSPITTDDTGSYTASVTVSPTTTSQYIQTVTVTDTEMVDVRGK